MLMYGGYRYVAPRCRVATRVSIGRKSTSSAPVVAYNKPDEWELMPATRRPADLLSRKCLSFDGLLDRLRAKH